MGAWGGSVWGGLGGATFPAPAAGAGDGDMLDAAVPLLLADADLVVAFGREGWLWHTLAPPDAPLPTAVLRDDGAAALGEAGEPAVWISDGTYSLTVYASDRATARSLCRRVMTALEAAADAGDLDADEGGVASLRRADAGRDALDPDPGPNGEDVWSHRIAFRVFVDPETP